MLKACRKSICRTLKLIFQKCISNGVFPSEWKKGNEVAIYKENNNIWETTALTRYYQPVAKPLMKCSCFFIKNGLILQNQSAFKPADSCVDQFLSITRHTNRSVRDLMLDISFQIYQKRSIKYGKKVLFSN